MVHFWQKEGGTWETRSSQHPPPVSQSENACILITVPTSRPACILRGTGNREHAHQHALASSAPPSLLFFLLLLLFLPAPPARGQRASRLTFGMGLSRNVTQGRIVIAALVRLARTRRAPRTPQEVNRDKIDRTIGKQSGKTTRFQPFFSF